MSNNATMHIQKFYLSNLSNLYLSILSYPKKFKF